MGGGLHCTCAMWLTVALKYTTAASYNQQLFGKVRSNEIQVRLMPDSVYPQGQHVDQDSQRLETVPEQSLEKVRSSCFVYSVACAMAATSCAILRTQLGSWDLL